MTFTLTEAVVHAILDPVAQGDWAAFQAAIDEDVVWIIADPVNDARTLAGTYVRFVCLSVCLRGSLDTVNVGM